MQQLIETVKELGTPTVFDWAPMLFSALAVFVAIYIPSTIAKKQNQIAIFDKLYNAYSQLLLVQSFAEAIKEYRFLEVRKTNRNRELFCVHFESSFGYHPDLHFPEDSIGKAIAALRKNESQAHMLPLLVSENGNQKKQCEKMISEVYELLFLLATEVIMFDSAKAEETQNSLKEFVDKTESFFQKYAEEIENALMCGKNTYRIATSRKDSCQWAKD